MSDLISRADAIGAVCGDCSIETKNNCKEEGYCYEVRNLKALPSADAVSDAYKRGFDDCKRAYEIELVRSADAKAHEEEHLNIINRIKELQYEIAKTQTVVSKMVKSAEAVQGEWEDMEIQCNPYPPIFCVECSACGYRVGRETFLENTFNFCPNCGAKMKEGTE